MIYHSQKPIARIDKKIINNGMERKSFTIGTRGSMLALAMTKEVMAILAEHHPQYNFAYKIITTSGDMTQAQNQSLATIGGKGLFTKEIEDELLAGTIDFAVHAMKDMPTILPQNLIIPCLLPREDAGDAFFSPHGKSLDDLPLNAIVGTSSLRRSAMIKAHRPDLKTVTFRGNVDTRLQKLKDGVVDATILAVSGLKRLGMKREELSIISQDILTPAVAQGAMGIECRADDALAQALLKPLNCETTMLCVMAERALLKRLDGSCRTPIGGYARMSNDEMIFDAVLASDEGDKISKISARAKINSRHEAEKFGDEVGQKVKEKYQHG
jgi:hydroxymethylbilane synthase